MLGRTLLRKAEFTFWGDGYVWIVIWIDVDGIPTIVQFFKELSIEELLVGRCTTIVH